jgi:hypothetical protein
MEGPAMMIEDDDKTISCRSLHGQIDKLAAYRPSQDDDHITSHHTTNQPTNQPNVPHVRALELADPNFGRLVVLVGVDRDVVGGVLLPVEAWEEKDRVR